MLRLARDVPRIFALAVTALVVLPAPSYAQRGRGGGVDLPPEALRAQQEEADFNAFLGAPDPDKKIKLSGQFLSNYPQSKHNEIIYAQLVTIYYAKQDWDNFYATADKTITSYPDNVDVLALVGWVIPHSSNQNDPDAVKKLDKAESYEKHAIELISSMSKPASLTDDQFAAAKTGKLAQAHSGLGLVYFRKQNWDDSVKELQEATQTVDSPDQTDLYALAFGLGRLSRYSEAAEAYDKCSLAPGLLQARCKESADNARGHILQPN